MSENFFKLVAANRETLSAQILPILISLTQSLASASGSVFFINNLGQGNGAQITSNSGGQAAMVINDTGAGDLFTASASGATKFIVRQNGSVVSSGTGSFTGANISSLAINSAVYTDNNKNLTTTAPTSGALGYWTRTGTTLTPTTNTDSFGFGSTSQFQITNAGAVTAVGVNAGSGALTGTGGVNVSGNITLAGTAGNTLTLGNSTGTFQLTTSGTGLNVATNGDLTFNNASMSGSLTIANSQVIKSAYGGLNLQYKSGPNTWANDLVLNSPTGDIDLAGGYANTGCTITNANGNLNCTGTIYSNSVALPTGTGTNGQVTYWNSTGLTGDANFTYNGTGQLTLGSASNYGIISLKSGGATNPTLTADASGNVTLQAPSGQTILGSGTGDITINPGTGSNNIMVQLNSGGSGTGSFNVYQNGGNPFFKFTKDAYSLWQLPASCLH
jgi:hypothetical protein